MNVMYLKETEGSTGEAAGCTGGKKKLAFLINEPDVSIFGGCTWAKVSVLEYLHNCGLRRHRDCYWLKNNKSPPFPAAFFLPLPLPSPNKGL